MGKLALRGGRPVFDSAPGSPWPIVDDADRERLLAVLDSRRWGRSAFDYYNHDDSVLYQFERRFAEFHDGRYALAVSTGTTALETCLAVVGVEAGCEVIVPAMSYIASASCVLRVNGVPIFAEVDPDTYTIDPRSVAALVTPRTRAVIAVDFGGMPCDTDALGEICSGHGFALISDCAHAHGGQWREKGVGSWATVAAFSCMPGKTLAIGEGGVVMTSDQELYERAFRYHHAGRVRGETSPSHTWPATTLRLSEFEAALGLGGLERLAEQADIRDANTRYLAAGLESIPGLAPLRRDPRVTRWNPYRWHFRFQAEGFDGLTREQFLAAVRAEGLPIGIGPTKPLYTFEMFRGGEWGQTGCPVRCPLYGQPIDYSQVHCPEAERIHATEACDLGHRILLGPQERMERILEVFHKVRDGVDEARA